MALLRNLHAARGRPWQDRCCSTPSQESADRSGFHLAFTTIGKCLLAVILVLALLVLVNGVLHRPFTHSPSDTSKSSVKWQKFSCSDGARQLFYDDTCLQLLPNLPGCLWTVADLDYSAASFPVGQQEGMDTDSTGTKKLVAQASSAESGGLEEAWQCRPSESRHGWQEPCCPPGCAGQH